MIKSGCYPVRCEKQTGERELLWGQMATGYVGCSHKGIDFYWIRWAGCSLLLPRNSGWNCEVHQKDFDQSVTEASRQKAIKRKLQILSHKWVSMKVVTHNFR